MTADQEWTEEDENLLIDIKSEAEIAFYMRSLWKKKFQSANRIYTEMVEKKKRLT